jgi:hypothetical protein
MPFQNKKILDSFLLKVFVTKRQSLILGIKSSVLTTFWEPKYLKWWITCILVFSTRQSLSFVWLWECSRDHAQKCWVSTIYAKHSNLFLPPSITGAITPVGPTAMSSMGAHQISLVQLVVGFGTAWITTLFISKSISLRSALKSLGWGLLIIRDYWTLNEVNDEFLQKELPGKGDPAFTSPTDCRSCWCNHLPI